MKYMQRNIFKTALVGTFLSVVFLVFSGTALADWNYITLSNYYALPGQQISVYGNGYEPGESVNVSVGGSSQTVIANNSGQFNSPNFTISFSVVGQKIPVTVSGNMGHSNSATLEVGTFYPVVTPNSWYLVPGSQVSFHGVHFAPNEQVNIQSSGNMLAAVTADGNGSFSGGPFTVPYTSGSLTYTFTGQNSGVVFWDKIQVSATAPVVTLNNYYAPAGSNLQINGQFFGSNEKVDISFAGIPVATATTDGNGSFSANFIIPQNTNPGQQTVLIKGENINLSVQAVFTEAGIYQNNSNNAGTQISVVSVSRIKNNLSVGQTATTITPVLINSGSAAANNVAVNVQLLNSDAQAVAQQAYTNQTMPPNVQMNFSLATGPNLAAGSYTIGTVVTNPESSILASFNNLGGITVQ